MIEYDELMHGKISRHYLNKMYDRCLKYVHKKTYDQYCNGSILDIDTIVKLICDMSDPSYHSYLPEDAVIAGEKVVSGIEANSLAELDLKLAMRGY